MAPRFRPVALRPRLSSGFADISLVVNMPKKTPRDKRGSSRMSSGAVGISRRPDSVKDLLARRAPTLTRVTTQSARANFWNAWLSERLPAEMRARLSGVVERDGTLVIFAESAAWSARLRFYVQELEPQILAAATGLSAILVRVRPRD